jgi:alkylation response protein AidB-like acyl-CoA dehydrogenase
VSDDFEAYAREWKKLALMLLSENAELRRQLVEMTVRLETARRVNRAPVLRALSGGKP